MTETRKKGGAVNSKYWKRVLYYIGRILAFGILILGAGVVLPAILMSVSHWALAVYLAALGMVGLVAMAMYLAKTE